MSKKDSVRHIIISDKDLKRISKDFVSVLKARLKEDLAIKMPTDMFCDYEDCDQEPVWYHKKDKQWFCKYHVELIGETRASLHDAINIINNKAAETAKIQMLKDALLNWRKCWVEEEGELCVNYVAAEERLIEKIDEVFPSAEEKEK